jgi:methylenetetrahydrofolate--tRNA-(uracil-5-)-methyltransferase
MVDRGPDTLRFGPLKPVGLKDPNTGLQPYACIQLRKENVAGTMYSMVGFQTKMKWPEQKRVFSKIPAFKNLELFRYGSVHRNTYVLSPEVLNNNLSMKSNSRVFLAGQITGVEGYTESAAIGLLAGRLACSELGIVNFTPPPIGTVLGALFRYVTEGTNGKYAPMNANFGLMPEIPKVRGVSKKQRRQSQCENSQRTFISYLSQLQETLSPNREVDLKHQ